MRAQQLPSSRSVSSACVKVRILFTSEHYAAETISGQNSFPTHTAFFQASSHQHDSASLPTSAMQLVFCPSCIPPPLSQLPCPILLPFSCAINLVSYQQTCQSRTSTSVVKFDNRPYCKGLLSGFLQSHVLQGGRGAPKKTPRCKKGRAPSQASTQTGSQRMFLPWRVLGRRTSLSMAW